MRKAPSGLVETPALVAEAVAPILQIRGRRNGGTRLTYAREEISLRRAVRQKRRVLAAVVANRCRRATTARVREALRCRSSPPASPAATAACGNEKPDRSSRSTAFIAGLATIRRDRPTAIEPIAPRHGERRRGRCLSQGRRYAPRYRSRERSGTMLRPDRDNSRQRELS